MSSYNLADLLSWNKAKLVKQSGTPLLDEFENVVEWRGIPRGAKEELRQYVLDSLQIVDDITFPNTQEKLIGRYCATKIATFDTEDGVTLHVTYDKYYLDTWTWDEVELTEPARLEDTTNFAILKMKHGNDNKLVDILASIPTTFTNQVIHAGTLSGAWKKIKARTIQVEDGRGWILLYCARDGINIALYGATSVYSEYDKFTKGYTDYYYGVIDPNGTGLVLGAGTYLEADGYTFDKNVSRNDDTGLYDVVIRKRASQVAATTTNQKEMSAIYTRTLVTDKNQTTAAAHTGSLVDGIVTSVIAQENEFGRFDNTTDSDASVKADTAWKSFPKENGSGRERTIVNATMGECNTAIGELTPTYNSNISISPTKYKDRYNISLSEVPANGGSAYSGGYEKSYFDSDDMPLEDDKPYIVSGTAYKNVHFQILTTSSAADADSFINGGVVNSHAIPSAAAKKLVCRCEGHVTDVRSLGSKWYCAERVYVTNLV